MAMNNWKVGFIDVKRGMVIEPTRKANGELMLTLRHGLAAS